MPTLARDNARYSVGVANRIRELRLERAKVTPTAFTIRAVAQRVGVTEGMVRRWEQGRAVPRQRHASRLARDLGVTIDELGLEPDEVAE